jgi:hypothetical protein
MHTCMHEVFGEMWNFNELKRKVIALFEDGEELQPLPGYNTFADVCLPLEGEGVPKNVLPEADFAARFNGTYLYVEVDTGGGVSHNLAKYFYVLDCLKSKPKRILVFHILGPEFLETPHNLEFNRKLASFLAEKIKDAFKDEFEFYYEQSEPFLNNEEALKWLSEKLCAYNIKKKV